MPTARSAALTAASAAVLTGLTGLLAGLLAACSSSGGGQSGSAGSGSARTTAAHVGNVTITAANGCSIAPDTFAAGGITFKIQNKDATAVSEVELLSGERIIGEKENLPPGLGGQFAVRVDAGRYTLYCPGANTEKTTITVTGKSAPIADNVAALIKQGTTQYKTYVDTQIGYLVTATQKLDDALHGNKLNAAQDAYIAARPFYEKIEPVAESFVNGKQNLDADIDARAGDVPRAQWSGFHLIEQALFQKRTLAGMQPWGDDLVKDVKELQVRAEQLNYLAPDLANGAQGLLDEVASSKITGEEERYSHIDMVDMANNIEGSRQAFADLAPAMKKIDPTLTSTISSGFVSLDKLVDTYRTTSNPSGYVLYNTLDDTDRHNLAAAIKAVQEPLSRVAAKVADA
jgi:iron uptake system component EfeO